MFCEWEQRRDDTYTDSNRDTKSATAVYECIKVRDNWRKNCYSKKDETSKNEFTDED